MFISYICKVIIFIDFCRLYRCPIFALSNYNTMTNQLEFTKQQAIDYLKSKGKKSGRFYYNVYGWSHYYTLEPTFATPTGKNKDYPRTLVVKVS